MEKEIYEFIIQAANMNYAIKLLILVAVFKPQIFSTTFQWGKYFYNTKKFEKLRTLVLYTFTRHKYSVSDIDASIKFNSLIEGERLRYNAMQSNYSIYHNGISNSFRNYSCRVESVREAEFSWLPNMQSLPLSPFEMILQRFEEEPIQIIDSTDEPNHYNQMVLVNLKRLGAKRLIIIPVVIPVKEAMPGYTYALRRNVNGTDSYIVGCISSTLDSESYPISKNDIIVQGKALIDQIFSMYLKNPKTLVK